MLPTSSNLPRSDSASFIAPAILPLWIPNQFFVVCVFRKVVAYFIVLTSPLKQRFVDISSW